MKLRLRSLRVQGRRTNLSFAVQVLIFMQIRGKRKRFLSRSLRPTEGFDPEGNLMWLLFYLNEYLCVYKHGIEKRGEEEKTSASNQIFLPPSLIISLCLSASCWSDVIRHRVQPLSVFLV